MAQRAGTVFGEALHHLGKVVERTLAGDERIEFRCGEEVQSELHEKLDPGLARVGLALFWFYLIMTLAVLLYYKRTLSGGDEAS